MNNGAVVFAAQMAHELNRAYCKTIGDESHQPWCNAPDWQRESAIEGVELHFAKPCTPQESHAAWLRKKLHDGWVYGEAKDTEKKTHPCCVAYDELPEKQKVKDYLFRGVCRAVLEMVTDGVLERGFQKPASEPTP